jgi:acetyl esterase/lipase
MTIAPAALNNTLCALRWIHQNADQYGFDVDRIVISGASSGGWFAVAAALTPKPAGWDASCPGVDEPAVAAVVNWYGNWDLADVLQGPNAKTYAPGWVRGSPEPMAIARSLSPLPIGDRAVPPVVSIHGDADSVVPYTQSVRLHEALKAAGIDEKLITIPNGGHGRFTTVENQNAYEEIRAFLSQQGIE